MPIQVFYSWPILIIIRTNMSTNRLNGLATPHCHYDIDCTNSLLEQFVDIFAKQHPHKMALINILQDEKD